MRVLVHVCACVHESVCVCMCAWQHVCMPVCMYLCMHVCVRACVHACVCVCMCVWQSVCMPVSMYDCVCESIYICVWEPVSVCMCGYRHTNCSRAVLKSPAGACLLEPASTTSPGPPISSSSAPASLKLRFPGWNTNHHRNLPLHWRLNRSKDLVSVSEYDLWKLTHFLAKQQEIWQNATSDDRFVSNSLHLDSIMSRGQYIHSTWTQRSNVVICQSISIIMYIDPFPFSLFPNSSLHLRIRKLKSGCQFLKQSSREYTHAHTHTCMTASISGVWLNIVALTVALKMVAAPCFTVKPLSVLAPGPPM